MTEVVVIPNCRCQHAVWRHVAGAGPCKSRACGCLRHRPAAPPPTATEQAVIDRFGIFEEDE